MGFVSNLLLIKDPNIKLKMIAESETGTAKPNRFRQGSKPKSLCFGLSILLVLVSVTSTKGIKCYHCFDANDDCAKNGPGKIVDCDSSEASGWKDLVGKSNWLEEANFTIGNQLYLQSASANACQKTTIQGEGTLRNCMISTPNVDNCVDTTRHGRKVKGCLCSTSLCNGSPSTIPGIFMYKLLA